MGKPGLFTNVNHEPSYDPNRIARASKALYYFAAPALLYIAGRELFPLEVTNNPAIAKTLSTALLFFSGSVVGYMKNSESCVEQAVSTVGGNFLTILAGCISPESTDPLLSSFAYYGGLANSSMNGPVRRVAGLLLATVGWGAVAKSADIINKHHQNG